MPVGPAPIARSAAWAAAAVAADEGTAAEPAREGSEDRAGPARAAPVPRPEVGGRPARTRPLRKPRRVIPPEVRPSASRPQPKGGRATAQPPITRGRSGLTVGLPDNT